MLVYIKIERANRQKLVDLLRERDIPAWDENIVGYPVIGVLSDDAKKAVKVLRGFFVRKLDQMIADYDSFNEDKDLDELYAFLRYNFRLENYLAMRAAIDTSCKISEKEYDDLKGAIDDVLALK